jgi:hypothetical protein
MSTDLTKNTFSSTYKDDFLDSDNYHRILFNSGRALQARELTQMQTITQSEISRMGRHMFREGAAVNPGGTTINTAYEFIKLVGNLPTGNIIGLNLSSTSNSIIVEVLEAVERVSASEPATIYVKYVSSTGGTSGTTPVRVTAGDTLTGGGETLTVQTTNTVSNPATGVGTRVSIHAGDFFAVDRFVFAREQSMILSKYTSDPDAVIGFKVTQDIVTVDDTTALYDNTGATPNISSPGADRYRIRLDIADKAKLAADESFVYVAKVVDGLIVTQVDGTDSYNKIEDRMALRTSEESGNYIAKRFSVSFDTNDSDESILDFDISPGVAYVDGYRAVINSPVKIGVSKPRTTQTENNEVTAAAYGQYVIVSANKGLPNIASFQEVTLFPNTAGTGTAIGTARVRSIEEDGSNYRVYLFDVQIASGKNKRNTKSLGTGSTDYMTLVLENSLAAFKDEASTSLLFPVPGDRPKTITDISLTVQRYRTANISSGSATITVTNTGETFADTSNWIAAHADSDVDVLFTASGAGTAASNLTGQQDGTYEILTYVNKSAGSVRTKTLTEVTETITPDGSGNLNFTKADVSSITRITLADSDGADLTSSYTLDNGQRDFAYLNGRMVKKAGAATPGSDVFVRYDHFVHGTSGDFFAVNSYTGQVDYENIPSYTQANGTEVSLRNVLDFRSSVNSSGNFGSGARINEMPKNTGLITFDAEYYLGKKVRVTIDKNSFIDTISGAASVSPQLPPAPNNSLDLFHIDMNPYTVSDTDITSTTIKAKNFTMRDIGKLEERIDNVEEATSLSLLELDTSSFNVLDASGNNRTQSGFFVDNFADQARSYMSADYNAAIDPEARIMRPWFEENNLRLIYDSDQSSNTILKGDSVYLKHDNINYVDQPLATEAMNINPFAVILNEGFIDLSPSSDEWTAVDRLPDRVEDGGTRLINNGALLWNTWRWNWIGRNDTTGRNLTARDTARNNILAVNRVVASETVREFVNDRILDVAFIPFMRSKKVFFRAQGLKPSTQVYAFFNNKPVADWVRSESFTRFATTTDDFGNRHNRATEHPDGKSTLTTGTDGSIEGSFFIPNTDAIKFRTGTREFKLLDISVPNDENATSIAKEPFASTGILETRQSTFTTTRVLTIAAPPPPVQPRRRRRRSTQDFVRSFAPQADPRNQRRRDPLAQTFFIDENDGAFITRVGVRFQTKDTTVPVMLQIRSTVNGVPSADEVIPNGVKVLSPSDVTESADASLVTYFEFDEPVYLNGNMEYSIVLLADSIEYNVYVAKAGDLMLNSTELRVAKQPTLGSLFKSQNSRTWTPDQERDLTFTIDRANFTVESGYVTLNNAPIPPILLASNPLDSTNSSATVKVLAFGHGLVVGDSVTIAGATTFGGIAASNINGTRAVTKVDGTGFEFVAGNSDTANQAVAGGGDNITVTRNIMMDTVVPYIETLSPAQTLISHSAKFTSGKSFAGSETAYSVDGSYQSISNRDNNTFANPRLIASSENETASLSGNKSLTYKIDVSTSTDIVAPVIDLQRASVTAVRNLVDQQVASGTGGNIPLEYVAETNPTGGSHLSKHITSPVVLDESAVGLKIMIGANRPSAASFDVYYRTNASDTAAAGNLLDSTWVLATLETEIPSDQNINVFREYRYLVGGDGGTMDAFSQFQVKIVLKSTNTSTPPVIQDLRIIALSV